MALGPSVFPFNPGSIIFLSPRKEARSDGSFCFGKKILPGFKSTFENCAGKQLPRPFMQFVFQKGFLWGTSTAAAQVETASDRTWRGLRAKDGYIFERTTDHELRRVEDAALIARFGSIYRCGVDWSRLQQEPYVKFNPDVVAEYQH